jgi:succinylglutamate desuccinylase
MKLILSLILFSLSAFAHNNTSLRTYHLIGPETKVIDAVAEEFEVVKKLSNGFEIYVPVSKIKRFMELAPQAKLFSAPLLKNTAFLNGYRDYKKVEEELKQLANQYPEIAKLETYGTTEDGHILYVLKVSDNVQIDEDEPELMITSATHGDEIITVEVEMELIKSLLQNYEKDARLTKMLKEKEIFFIPMVNPQGYSQRDRYANNNTDPNRDYPYPGDENKKSVDCIDAVRKWFHSKNIKGSIDLHAYGKLIMFPWAYTKDSPPKADEINFQYLTNSMSEINKYEAGQISKIIYVAKGSSADYYYWKNKTFALGIELSSSKAPPFGAVPRIVEESREMIWRFIEHF